MAPTDSSAPSFIERVQDFVADNRRAILIGTAITVGGAAAAVYYASTSQRSTDAVDPERPRSKDKKKGAKPSKKRKPPTKDAPILEEVPPKSPKPDDDEGAAPVRLGTLGNEISF